VGGGLKLFSEEEGRGKVNCVTKTYTTVNNNSEVVIYRRLQ